MHLVGYFHNQLLYTGLVQIMLTLMDCFSPADRRTVRSEPLPWPPHSCDLTPCDFWLWDMVKERVYSRKILDINDLKDRIRTVISSIPREMYVRALNGTVVRWLFCVKHDGEQVETVL